MEQRQARIGAKVGKQRSKGRQQKDQRQARKGAKVCKKSLKGRQEME